MQSQNNQQQQFSNNSIFKKSSAAPVDSLTNFSSCASIEEKQDFSTNSNEKQSQESNLKNQIKNCYFSLKQNLIDAFNAKKAFFSLKKLSLLYSSTDMNPDNAQSEFLFQSGIIAHIFQNIFTYQGYEYGKELQSAVLWLLANTMALLKEDQIFDLLQDLPIFETFYALLDSSIDENNLEQSLWTIANLISYIPIRDFAIGHGLIECLIKFIKKITEKETDYLFTVNINRTLTWLISNVCRKPSPNFYEVSIHFLPYLATILHLDDNQTLRDACFAIGNMTLTENNSREADHQQIQEILMYGIGDKAIALARSENIEVQISSLVLLGHLTYGSENQTQYLIDVGILQAIQEVLETQSDARGKKEAIFCLSNILAGSAFQLSQILKTEIMENLKKIAQTTKHQYLMEECLYCIMNATYNCSVEQADWLVQQKFQLILAGQYKMRAAAGEQISKDVKDSLQNIIHKIKEVDELTKKVIQNVGLEEILKKKNKIQSEILDQNSVFPEQLNGENNEEKNLQQQQK